MAQLDFIAGPKEEPKVWSQYQNAVFNFVRHGQGNAIVNAVAGSGKSTTIEQANKFVHGESLFLAFNKAIADELKARGLNARTFHSLCYGPVLRATGAKQVDENKLFKMMKEHWNEQQNFLYGNWARKLIGLAKQNGIGCIIDNTRSAWIDIAEHHDLALNPEDGVDPEYGLDLCRKFFEVNIASSMVDFDDLLYYAVRYTIPLKKYDFIFCDEGQDTNAIQRAILKKVRKNSSRMIVVGDRSQAIYGFRGADSNSLDLIRDDFDCTELPLSISYRCARKIVEHARQWENTILPREGAPEGVVEERKTDWNISEFTEDDLVVCRTTAPLISIAFRMLKKRLPVKILGRDIGVGLKRLVEKTKATTIDTLEEYLVRYCQREVSKYMQRGEEKLAEAVTDKVDALLVLCDSLAENERTVAELLRVLDSIFNNRSDCVTLCTIHKSKGLEADRVFWVNSSQCPSRWAKKPWQIEQEHNLCYVATTRAKNTLVLIETE